MSKSSFKHFLNMTGLKLKKVSPHIMVVIGIGGIIYTVIDSCRRARKLDETMAEELEEVNKAVEELKAMEEAEETSEADIKEAKKKVRNCRFKAIKKGAKVFLVPVLVGIFSLTLITSSHVILTNRLAGTSAALQAVTARYKAYQEAVAEKYGEEAEKEIRFAELDKDVQEATMTKIDAETGEETTETINVAKVTGLKGISQYAIPFCKTYCGSNFVDDHHYDTCTIFSIMERCQKDLDRKHYLFLDEVHKRFGYDPTMASRRVGWLIKENGEPNGDGRINFTVKDGYFDWGNGPEMTYIIDPNVDGEIDSLLPTPKKKWWSAA